MKPTDLERGAVCTDWICDCSAALVGKESPQGEEVESCHWQVGTGELASGWLSGIWRVAFEEGWWGEE